MLTRDIGQYFSEVDDDSLERMAADAKASLSLATLTRRLRELFGRVTSTVASNGDIWAAYSRFYGILASNLYASSERGAVDQGERIFENYVFMTSNLI